MSSGTFSNWPRSTAWAVAAITTMGISRARGDSIPIRFLRTIDHASNCFGKIIKNPQQKKAKSLPGVLTFPSCRDYRRAALTRDGKHQRDRAHENEANHP